MIDNEMAQIAVALALVFAALQLGAIEFLDADLLVELGLGKGSQGYSFAIGGVAVAGAVKAYSLMEEI